MTALEQSFGLGDMHVAAPVSPKLTKALAVIAEYLHPSFDRQPWIAHPGKSKESCVLCSLTVRDFLFRIGFKDVEVRPVAVVIQTTRNGEFEHSLGIGVPEDTRKVEGRWAGHMVAYLPSEKVLIDTTLYGAIRPQWADMSGMSVVPVPDTPPSGDYQGLPMIVGVGRTDPDREFGLFYFDRPGNDGWRKGDGSPLNAHRRKAVSDIMVEAFGDWR